MMKRHLHLWNNKLNENAVRKYEFCGEYARVLRGGGINLNDQIEKTEELLKRHKFSDVISALKYIFGLMFKPVKALDNNTLKDQQKTANNDDMGSVISHQSQQQQDRFTNIAKSMMISTNIQPKKYIIGKLFYEKGPNMKVCLAGTSVEFKIAAMWSTAVKNITCITSISKMNFKSLPDSGWAETMVYRRGSADFGDCHEISLAPGWPIISENFTSYLRNAKTLNDLDNKQVEF
jgi:hypothetical protein